MNLRVGNGYDIHRFADEARPAGTIRLGGIDIRHTHPLLAHSDGDVLIHALCDALLGALALGDIGQHFPDTDPAYRNIDSTRLLQHVYELITQRGWGLINADATVLAEAPKLARHVPAMRETLARLLEVSEDQVSVKATTCEGLGAIGRREGIACQVVVLLVEQRVV